MRGPAAARSTTNETVEGAESILGRGAKVRGRIGGDGDLRVEGQVEGDVRISGQLAIEEGGAITGDVEAAAVVIGGSLTGDVAAKGSVTIRAGAQVAGNMDGAEVVLEEGASFTGRIEAEFDMPAELEEAPTAPRHAAQAARGR
jgi:cytoskeletal protein CcmA (bactofilin family)